MTPVLDTWYVWLAIIVLALCTALTRASFLLLGDRMPLPDGVRRALRYAPAAALAAIIVPDLLPWTGAAPAFDAKLVAIAAAVAVMAYTRSTVGMIAAGMAVLWSLRWLLGG